MKYEIEIEGLPEGWEPVCYRPPKYNEHYLSINKVEKANSDYEYSWLIVEKIKPRRIVLEETAVDNTKFDQRLGTPYTVQYFINGLVMSDQPKIWREVKEDEEQK